MATINRTTLYGESSGGYHNLHTLAMQYHEMKSTLDALWCRRAGHRCMEGRAHQRTSPRVHKSAPTNLQLETLPRGFCRRRQRSLTDQEDQLFAAAVVALKNASTSSTSRCREAADASPDGMSS